MSRIRGKELEAALLDIVRNMALSQLQEFELKTNGGNCPDNFERGIESLKSQRRTMQSSSLRYTMIIQRKMSLVIRWQKRLPKLSRKSQR